MLKLTRKPGESIHIGGDAIVYIDRIDGGKVKVSIDAPDDVLILRGELTDATPPLMHVDYVEDDY
ncbi:carbon storage regulator [Zhongshania antarctica]|uniref:Translational regulator CsrA n=1 Tax=Zhongshania antarctica TaxID=641702 RepID=A0A840RA89_9GAMM|nr:carbon storage regulator [Zhongshania antarctica]MBB5189250.1 carbon storage regulator [Zhongshania antarctica]